MLMPQRVVVSSCPPPVDQAMMDAASAPPVDCDPASHSDAAPIHIVRVFTFNGLFNFPQDVMIANLRAFAHGLKMTRKGNTRV
jgi:hypothetical protein